MKMVSLKEDSDLLEALVAHAKSDDCKSCWIFGIGALKKANLAWYNQEKMKYEERVFNEDLEITSLSGNISLINNPDSKEKIFPHFHLSLSDKEGNAYGGHALPGCKIFVCEIACIPSDEKKVREYDKKRGLWLWPQ